MKPHAILRKAALLSGRDMHDLMACTCVLETAFGLLHRAPDGLTSRDSSHI